LIVRHMSNLATLFILVNNFFVFFSSAQSMQHPLMGADVFSFVPGRQRRPSLPACSFQGVTDR
jgi:hypothetical protein